MNERLHSPSLGYVLVCCVLVLTSPAQGSDTPAKLFAEGDGLMKLERYEEALAKFEAHLKGDPSDGGAIYNAGLAAYLSGRFELAVEHWERLVAANPEDWEVHAKLVQAFQALGDLRARDEHRSALFALRKAKVSEDLAGTPEFRRDQFVINGKKVVVFEAFEPKGDDPAFYTFVVARPKTVEEEFRVSLRSDRRLTQTARELGEIGPSDRLFQLESDHANGARATFRFFKNLPTYEVVRDSVVAIVKKEVNAISAFIPNEAAKSGMAAPDPATSASRSPQGERR